MADFMLMIAPAGKQARSPFVRSCNAFAPLHGIPHDPGALFPEWIDA
jgi:hypothetical protein